MRVHPWPRPGRGPSRAGCCRTTPEGHSLAGIRGELQGPDYLGNPTLPGSCPACCPCWHKVLHVEVEPPSSSACQPGTSAGALQPLLHLEGSQAGFLAGVEAPAALEAWQARGGSLAAGGVGGMSSWIDIYCSTQEGRSMLQHTLAVPRSQPGSLP